MLVWASQPEPDRVLSVTTGSGEWCEGWVVRGQRRKGSFWPERSGPRGIGIHHAGAELEPAKGDSGVKR